MLSSDVSDLFHSEQDPLLDFWSFGGDVSGEESPDAVSKAKNSAVFICRRDETD